MIRVACCELRVAGYWQRQLVAEKLMAHGSGRRRAGRGTMTRQARRMAQGKGQRILSFYIVAKSHSQRLLKLWERLLVAKAAF